MKLRIILIAIAGFLILVTLMAGCPVYKVWVSKKDGEAELAHANYAKEVAVAEARAKKESATYLAEAEIKRAEGIAKANLIIGNSLNNNPNYLTWLWIDQISKNQNEIIYVPTEANIPIMEASRWMKKQKSDSTAWQK